MRKLWLLCPLLCTFSACLPAQTLNDLRGTWITRDDGPLYVLYLVAHEGQLSGTFCHDCSNPDNLGLVDDSTLAASDIQFTVAYSPRNRPPVSELASARLQGNTLRLTLKDSKNTRILQLERPAPFVTPAKAVSPSPPVVPKAYVPPAPAAVVTVQNVSGVWLSGSGPGKQYFIFKPHKNNLRGLVCGPCDNPASFAPLEAMRLEGDTLYFDIVHEDNGFGIEEHGPFRNITSARVVRNEMHLHTVASFEPDATPYEMTLLGPVYFMPLTP